eukprot:s2547_g8.t1
MLCRFCEGRPCSAGHAASQMRLDHKLCRHMEIRNHPGAGWSHPVSSYFWSHCCNLLQLFIAPSDKVNRCSWQLCDPQGQQACT